MVASVGQIASGTGYEYLAKEVATSKHDYYAGLGEAPGIWRGSGCAELGLAGIVDERDMESLYGRFVDPRTAGADEVVLGRKVSARVVNAGMPNESESQPKAAFDVTFSPSKSVSALWAAHGSERVRQLVIDAHDAAVAAGLDYLEANAGHSRVGAGGRQRIDTSGFIVAQFRHRTARSTEPGVRVGDPQLHTHCAIFNRVCGVDGVWRTLDSRAIYRHAHTAGALYGAVLERELTERLGIDWVTPGDGQRVPMREIAGVPQELIDRWSSRRRQVNDTYEVFLDEFRQEHSRTPTRDERAQLKDRATLESRQPKAGGVSDLHTAWRGALRDGELTAVEGSVGRVAPRATTGGRLAADDPQLEARVTESLQGQRAHWTRVHVYGEVARWIDAPTPEAIELTTERMMLGFVCLEPDDDEASASLDATRYTSQPILDAERQVIGQAQSRADWAVAPKLARTLGDDQMRAVEALTAGPYQLATVIGPAGAGKTTMLSSVAASYRADGRHICVLALSAAAARVVTDETGLAANTIAAWQHGQVALPARGLVLIDEASMVPTLALRDLCAAARAKGCRVGLVGDYAQMGSPEAGGLLRDLAALPSATRLTAVRRFTEDWERRASVEIQQRDRTTAINYDEHGRIHETTSDRADADVAEAWFADHQAGLDSLVVADTNHEAGDVAASCQRLLSRAGLLGDEVGLAADHNMLHVGDQIQTRLNTVELETSDGERVLNRDVWTIRGWRADGSIEATHRTRNATVVITPEYRAKHTVLAYATTIAGAQGRTTDTGHVVVTPRTNADALYVGMTRGRLGNHAHVVTDGHDHDELGLGHRSGLTAFAEAIVRNPEGDTSATMVMKRWEAARQQASAAQRDQRATEQAAHWWKHNRNYLPRHARAILAGADDKIVAALATTPPSGWRATVRIAVQTTGWTANDAVPTFLARVEHPRTTAWAPTGESVANSHGLTR